MHSRYFPETYKRSGYETQFLKHGDHFSHENCPRSKIFRRDEATVVDTASMLNLLRSDSDERTVLLDIRRT